MPRKRRWTSNWDHSLDLSVSHLLPLWLPKMVLHLEAVGVFYTVHTLA